jgi:hypothetical protein
MSIYRIWSRALQIWGGPPASGSGVGLKAPHCKNPARYEILHGASDRLERSKQSKMDMILEHGM